MARKRFQKTPVAEAEAFGDPLVKRVIRLRRRGEDRRAMLMLRDACSARPYDAKLWTIYGAQCSELGRTEVARQAYQHALWLRERARDHGRTATTRRLLEALDEAA